MPAIRLRGYRIIIFTSMGKKKKPSIPSSTIVLNKKARHDYHLEDDFEAGIALEGWEVKSLRAGRAQLKESYVIIRQGELYLFGAHFSPLPSASTHVHADPTRSRKLLLNRREIDRLKGAVDRSGYTIVPLSLYWKKGRVKLKIALAKGKKMYDKRASIKQREWDRDKQRLLKAGSR